MAKTAAPNMTERSSLSGVVSSQRKGFTAWSRTYQFAALRPVRGGTARLGPALPPGAFDELLPATKEAWSERLKTVVVLLSPDDVQDRTSVLLKAAWTAS